MYINVEIIIFFMLLVKIEVEIMIENIFEIDILCWYDLKLRYLVCLVCFYF